ncbi:carbamoyltransferase HypF [Ferrimonas marina]|uniref:Carbamoyltransferase HypF n=1 Tax=Ferrimonas marina TaxID=299255 RepID=A0A1M5VGF9_9GAMM|nr:carbamoyltransferase HypF [Ferrimonas marina]SHH74327.1 hydrogenase maturation protein HypF [Ferrimonas marina]
MAVAIRVRGQVQGVGFRPFVWQVAQQLDLAGEVLNDAEGVLITLAPESALEAFLQQFWQQLPPLARVDELETQSLAADELPHPFVIAASRGGDSNTRIAPDTATCRACRSELLDPRDRRFHYPFTNCTHCGPRFSIIESVPYDRPATSMKAFPLCPQCQQEYDHPADRRFHAQPNACAVCGPRLALLESDGSPTQGDPLAQAVRRLQQGEILAIKGLGGYHLAVDAGNEAAVARLRQRKRRPRKPFALLMRDSESARHHVLIDPLEQEQLESAAAPIVLLTRQASGDSLAPSVAPAQHCLGVMLPSNPLQILLMEAFERPLVMTSGNASGRPPCIDDGEALTELGPIADALLIHDRAIVNRVDDSIVRVVSGRAQLLRRARGFVPAPLPLPPGFEQADGLLAYGADLKNTFAYVKRGQLLLSQHLGDLDDPLLFATYQRNLTWFAELFDVMPSARVCDAHPGYHSHRLAMARGARPVAHHHAHLASGLVDNHWPRQQGPVLAWVLDGTGFGDGSTSHDIWGGELLLGDYHGCQRLTGLPAVALPGGERAAKEPWRNLLAQLECYAPDWETHSAETLQRLARQPLAPLRMAMAQGLNAPLASSTGRLFDAAAALLDCRFDAISFEGEAAMALESLAWQAPQRHLPSWQPHPEVALAPIWRGLLDGLAQGRSRADLAFQFHVLLANELAAVAVYHARAHGIEHLLFSGGVMQNALLQTLLEDQLRGSGLTLLWHRQVPANDGGLAVGQAAIEAASQKS